MTSFRNFLQLKLNQLIHIFTSIRIKSAILRPALAIWRSVRLSMFLCVCLCLSASDYPFLLLCPSICVCLHLSTFRCTFVLNCLCLSLSSYDSTSIYVYLHLSTIFIYKLYICLILLISGGRMQVVTEMPPCLSLKKSRTYRNRRIHYLQFADHFFLYWL